MVALPRTVWIRVLSVGVIVALVVAIALGATTLLGWTFQGSERTGDLLITSNRDRLAVCVQAVNVDEGVASETKSRVEQLLPRLQEHPVWGPSGLGRNPPVVETDCSAEATLLSRVPAGIRTGAPLRVETPSYYLLNVFVVPQSEIERIFGQRKFGNLPIRRVPQEVQCQGDHCWEVTTALYMSPEEVRDTAFLGEWLVKAVGLEPVVPQESKPTTRPTN